MKIEEILGTVLHEAHEGQVEGTMDTLFEETEDFYKISLTA